LEKIFEAVKDSPLFCGIGFDEFRRLCACLSARTARYEKDEAIMLAGDGVRFVGLVLSGGVRIIKEDAAGNVSMLTMLSAGEMFADILACAGIYISPVTIMTAAAAEILFLDNRRIAASCPAGCASHKKLVENMLRLIAKKNFMLNRKIEILSKRTTREKLLCFFDLKSAGARRFTIAFNREELANYLCVDRSAMSNELCKMRDEGLIRFDKNVFELLYI